jgi:phospholipid/cholesterol/gamma-HCH transport system ATP-binding protein
MKHIIGLLKPDRGGVAVDGVDINGVSYKELRKVRRKFGVLFQGGALFDSMTAFDNVAFPLRTFTNQSEEVLQTRVRACLGMVELSDIGQKKPSELSGGMQKRVALARAIALEPKYIIYDEPTSGLDPETSNRIDDLIKLLADHLNITSVVITHDMHSVLSIADRVAFIYQGRLHWTGPVSELHTSDDEILLEFVRANEYKIGSPHATAEL